MEKVIEESSSYYDIKKSYYSKEYNTCVYELHTKYSPNYWSKYNCTQYIPDDNLSYENLSILEHFQKRSLEMRDPEYVDCENKRKAEEQKDSYNIKVLYDIIGYRDISRERL